MSFRLPAKVYSLVAVPLVFELAFVVVLVMLQIQLETAYKREIEAREVSNVINEALAQLVQAGATAAMGQATHDKLLIKEGQSQIKGLRRVHEKMLELDGLSEIDRQSIESISEMLESVFKNFPDYEDVPTEHMEKYVVSVHIQVQDLIRASKELLDRQSQIQISQKVEQEKLRSFLTSCIIFGMILNVILATTLASLFNRGITSRLNTVLENSKRLANSEEMLPRVGGEDEVSDLDAMFHLVAEKIERATEREKAILANSSDVIFSIDSLLEIQLVSASAKRLWGYDPGELQGREIDLVISGDEINELRTKLLALKESEESASFEIRVKRADGTFVDTSLSAFYSVEKQQIFCVAHDISARKELERQKEDFLSMVSHDLRSPLTSIGLNMELLDKGIFGKLSEKGQRLVTQSSADLERLKDLVNDILDADRLEKGRMDLSIKRHQSNLIKEAVLRSVSPMADKASVTIIDDWEDELVDCDKDRIIQVLINLVGNAIKFSNKNSIVRLGFSVSEDSYKFEVKDKGRGISDTDIERIFDKFRQVSTKDATEKGGSGLGLAICKSLVEAHGGTIGVESELDKGSCFWVRLPKT